jgi:hypothetical protein
VSGLQDEISRLRRLLKDKDTELGVLSLQKTKVGSLVFLGLALINA